MGSLGMLKSVLQVWGVAKGDKGIPCSYSIMQVENVRLQNKLLYHLLNLYLFLQETVNTGPFVMRTTCRQCRGMRVIVTVPCINCRASGTTMQRKKVMVPVPAGNFVISPFHLFVCKIRIIFHKCTMTPNSNM